MSKERLMKARDLIQAKRYDEARRILAGIDHPTAAKWLARLDQIAPLAAKKRYTPKKTAILFLAVIATLVIACIAWGQISLRQRATAVEPEARAYLDLMCTLGTRLGAVRCEQYVHQTVRQNPQWVLDIKFCGELYSPVSMVESFASCLVRNDVPLPV